MVENIVYTNREKTILYVAVLLGFMLDGYDLLITSFVLGPTASYFAVPIKSVAFALTLVLVASLIGGIGYGWLADRIGRRPTLFITIITYGVMTILTGLSTTLSEFYLFRFLTGLGVGGEFGIGFSLLNEAYSEKTRGAAGGWLASMYVWGSLLGAVTADYSLTTFGDALGWRYAYVIAGVAALVLVVLRFFVPESKIWQRYMALKKEGKLPEGYGKRQPITEIFTRKFIQYTLFGSLVVIGDFFFTYSFLTFIPTYFGSIYHIAVPTYTEMIIVAELVGIVGYTLMGFLSDRIGRKLAAIVYGVLGFIAVSIFWYEATLQPQFVSISVFPVFYAYMGVYFSAGFIAQYGVWIGEHYITKNRASGTNFTYMMGRAIGGGLPPIIVPMLMSYGGLGIAISIGMMIGVVIQFLAIFGLKETRGTIIKPV
ncbi:MAG: MFS transporter [Candidatus Bathyarchaeia archaeon]